MSPTPLTYNDSSNIAALPTGTVTWTSDPDTLSVDDQVTFYCGQAAFAGAKATATTGTTRAALIAAAAAALAKALAALGS